MPKPSMVRRILEFFTEEKATALPVDSTADRYRELLNESSDILFEMDETGRILHVNRRWEDWSGHPSTAATGVSLGSFLRERDRAVLANRLESNAVRIAPQTLEVFFARRETPAFLLRFRGTWLGESFRIFGSLAPILSEARTSNSRFQRLLRKIEGGFWEWNLVLDRVYIDARWKAQLGFQDHEVPNAIHGFEQLLHPDERRFAKEQIGDLIASGTHLELDMRLRTREGDFRWVRVTHELERDFAGKPLVLSGVMRLHDPDFSPRKEGEIAPTQ